MRTLKTWFTTVVAVVVVSSVSTVFAETKPNVLLIMVDDLNDWVGCLQGHPQAQTPHIDQLAASGTLFRNAHCAAPLCNPSRTAILTGLHPSKTGIYCNKGWFREHPDLKNCVTLPQYYSQHGYTTFMGGKIFHRERGKMSDPDSWGNQYSRRVGTTFPPEEKRYQHGLKGKFTSTPYFNEGADWAPLSEPIEKMPDWQTAHQAAEILEQDHDKPFFLACGIFRPHEPWYAPQEFFDLHPISGIQLPVVFRDDLDDVPLLGIKLARRDFEVIRDGNQWPAAVQGYMASISFADACVGQVLAALDKSKYAKNTIVVLCGDHGWHLGEKEHWSKFALWYPATHTPLIIRTLGDKHAAQHCDHAVSLLDIYPTLVDLCSLKARKDLDGRSLASLLQNPSREWNHPVLITHWRGNHAVQSNRHRYIQYRDGSEELYDHEMDPHEWKNFAQDPVFAEVKEQLKKNLPQENAEHFQPEAESPF